MSPRKTEQSELLKEQKKQQIMSVALDLFAFHGFQATSVDQIAKKAKISKGLVYNYFESKDELLRQILYEGYEKLNDNFDPDHDGVLTKEELLLYIDNVLNQMKDNPSYWKLYFILAMQPSIFIEFLMPMVERIEGIFKMLVDYFEKKGVSNPIAEAFFFASTFEGSCLYSLNVPGYPIKEIQKMIIDRFL